MPAVTIKAAVKTVLEAGIPLFLPASNLGSVLTYYPLIDDQNRQPRAIIWTLGFTEKRVSAGQVETMWRVGTHLIFYLDQDPSGQDAAFDDLIDKVCDLYRQKPTLDNLANVAGPPTSAVLNFAQQIELVNTPPVDVKNIGLVAQAHIITSCREVMNR